ncbi:MAG TPA: hypothetical protein VFQ91_08830, partial [Bryobacteraceae bacterium]|nr:hypothetical protein [Bryobacteraceae bacterium]
QPIRPRQIFLCLYPLQQLVQYLWFDLHRFSSLILGESRLHKLFYTLGRNFHHAEEDYDRQYRLESIELDQFRYEAGNVLNFCFDHGFKPAGLS